MVFVRDGTFAIVATTQFFIESVGYFLFCVPNFYNSSIEIDALLCFYAANLTS